MGIQFTQLLIQTYQTNAVTRIRVLMETVFTVSKKLNIFKFKFYIVSLRLSVEWHVGKTYDQGT